MLDVVHHASNLGFSDAYDGFLVGMFLCAVIVGITEYFRLERITATLTKTDAFKKATRLRRKAAILRSKARYAPNSTRLPRLALKADLKAKWHEEWAEKGCQW